MYHIFFIHSSTDEHLSCFYILAIVNNVAMNIEVHIYFRIIALVFFGYIPLNDGWVVWQLHFLKRSYYLFIFRERGRREKERERNIDQLPLAHARTGDQTRNTGMCPNRKSNWWPFTLGDDAQPTEPHWSGSPFLIFKGTSTLFSIVAAPIYSPTNREGGFPFLHILTSPCPSLSFWWWPFWQVWAEISLWFWFASPWWSLMLSIFSCASAICMLSLEKCLCRS